MTEDSTVNSSDPVETSDGSRMPNSLVPLLAVVSATVIYSLLALRRVAELRASAFDAGFLDNVLFKVSRGYGDVSGLTGVHHFGDHAAPLLLAAIPLYWINADVAYQILLVLQALSVAMVGLAAWLIADAIGLDSIKRNLALVFVLVSPAAYWAIITELHMTGLAMGFVAMTVAGAYRKWPLRIYWILPFLASLARIEIALTVVIVGLLLLPVSKRHGKVAVSVGAAVGIAIGVFMLMAPDPGSSFGAHFSYLGIESASELPIAILRNPGAVIQEILSPILLMSALLWFVMIGLVLPLRASRWLLVGIPMMLIPILGSHEAADYWYEHYWNLLLVGAAIAIVLSLKLWSRRAAVVLATSALVAAWIVAGPAVGPNVYRMVYPGAEASELEIADDLRRGSEPISVFSQMVLPGAHREWVYLFPNPFACRTSQVAYFVRSGPPPELVVANDGWEKSVSTDDAERIQSILATQYSIVTTADTYGVWRLKPGEHPDMIPECLVVASDS